MVMHLDITKVRTTLKRGFGFSKTVSQRTERQEGQILSS